MATKMASGNGTIAAGIFADMTVDGPEIGTLVAIVDRGKNLPNRKTVGKQNPYCAARLGKEARKTETDMRGGQTPKWDQELRFTVHDSPDYYNLKISVFSEDNKRTDLIGEAWMGLNDVIVPGGGKSDVWQGLHCKGKYAGEIRIELTYYDAREKPELATERTTLADEMKLQYNTLTSKVKRRPLPANPNEPSMTPVNVPDRPTPGRARHGPRDLSMPLRTNSTPTEAPSYPYSAISLSGQAPVNTHSHGNSPLASVQPEPPFQQATPNQYYGDHHPVPEPQFYDEPYEDIPDHPDFLPQLAPSTRKRGSIPPPANYPPQQLPPQQPHRPHLQAGLIHSHSAPTVPMANHDYHEYSDQYQLRTEYPEPIPDVDYQYQHVQQKRKDISPGWDSEYGHGHPDQRAYEDEEDAAPPPPPPMHSSSAPAVPQYGSPHNHPPSSASRYGATPPSARHPYVANSSPLQSIERNYSPQVTPSRALPPRGRSTDDYAASPPHRGYDSNPGPMPPAQAPLPHGRTPPSRQHPSRHSIAESYGTSPRPHPLSQEVPRARSPNPYMPQEMPGASPHGPPPYQEEYHGRNGAPIVKPRALSPQPPPPTQPSAPPRSSYNIRHPIRAFESSDQSPLSTSQTTPIRTPQVSARGTPTRKSVSPHPAMTDDRRSDMPFGPDSFDVHNPNVPALAEGDARRNGPIVGWHGNEIDPSDHLPVDSWAPEPQKKTPTKTYGQGRERDFGPRTVQSTPGSGSRISKDAAVTARMKDRSVEPEAEPQPARHRLSKTSGAGRSPIVEPLREHDDYDSIPNPYDQQQYGTGFYTGSPGISEGRGSRYDGYGPPGVPPKVPLQHGQQQQQPEYGNYGPDALTREISNIDIGTSRNRATPTAYQPVRSHRDRNSFY